MEDRPFVGHGDEVALVVRRALPEVVEVAGDVHRADERLQVGEFSMRRRRRAIRSWSTTVRWSVSWTPAATPPAAIGGAMDRG